MIEDQQIREKDETLQMLNPPAEKKDFIDWRICELRMTFCKYCFFTWHILQRNIISRTSNFVRVLFSQFCEVFNFASLLNFICIQQGDSIFATLNLHKAHRICTFVNFYTSRKYVDLQYFPFLLYVQVKPTRVIEISLKSSRNLIVEGWQSNNRNNSPIKIRYIQRKGQVST